MAQATWETNNILTTSWVKQAEITSSTEINKILQNISVTNRGSAAYHVGTANLSGGHNWSTGNQQFTIKVNDGGQVTVTLTANCANLAAVVTEINTRLLAAHVAGSIDTYDGSNQLIEAYDDGSNHAAIRTTNSGDSFVLTDVNAFTTLGWSAESYYGTDKVKVSVCKVNNGGNVNTESDRRDIMYNTDISAENQILEAPNSVLTTVGDAYWAKASDASMVTLLMSGTEGVI